MAIASIVIGDLSGDGHEKTTDYLVEVPDRFTQAVLAENYKKVRGELGFSLEDFADEYEDSLLPAPYLQALIEAGFDAGVLDSIADLDDDDDDYYLSPKDMFHIAIFMASKGLEGFEYRIVRPDFSVFGWTNMGYGLYY